MYTNPDFDSLVSYSKEHDLPDIEPFIIQIRDFYQKINSKIDGCTPRYQNAVSSILNQFPIKLSNGLDGKTLFSVNKKQVSEVDALVDALRDYIDKFESIEYLDFLSEEKRNVVFVGPNGCGKTTLLRLIAGLDTPTSGEIVANGEVVEKPSGDRAVIFQQYSLFPWMTVLQNVTFGLEMTKAGSKEENIAAAERYLENVGLIDFKDSYPHELSGGMKQRVAIIRSLLNHSPILLMDEPFSALDMQNRHSLQEQLIGVWKRFENTIVFVTHDVDEAVYLADKIVILDKNPGKIADIIEVDLQRPRKRESQEFIAIQESIVSQLNMEE